MEAVLLLPQQQTQTVISGKQQLFVKLVIQAIISQQTNYPVQQMQ